jgi:hypothetical protein
MMTSTRTAVGVMAVEKVTMMGQPVANVTALV